MSSRHPVLRREPPPRDLPRGTYVRHAVLSPTNLLAFGLIALLAANAGSWLVVLVGGAAQLVALGLLPSLSWFRRRVDESLALVEQQQAARTRAELLLRMTEEARHELARLEAIADRARSNLVGQHGAGVQPVLEDCFGLGRLLASYVRLAISYKSVRDFFDTTSRQLLVDEIDTLEGAQSSPAGSVRMRALSGRRLTIARRRLERWDRTRDDLEAISHQLATIRSLVHLVHELSMTPTDPDALDEELDGFMGELDGNEGTMRELLQLAAAEEVIDPQMLDAGRTRLRLAEAPAAAGGPALPRRW